mmetsp:Transcript_16252/g.22660  ORF Transcript_16252/g.22660 Transcript_16252/m.22660 type:complete len:200 (+) Transcript_16252:40-639(+)
MVKLSLLLGASAAASAAAFAPANEARSSTALNAIDQKQIGVVQPLMLFDPLDMMADEEAFERRRNSEIKHGRIAMMAVIGNIAPQLGFHFPGYLSTSAGVKFEDVGYGFQALSKIPLFGVAQIVLFAGIMETVQWAQKPGMAPGDVGGEDWIRYEDEATKINKLNIELNNGRAAMMGITGLMMQEQVTGMGIVEQMSKW